MFDTIPQPYLDQLSRKLRALRKFYIDSSQPLFEAIGHLDSLSLKQTAKRARTLHNLYQDTIHDLSLQIGSLDDPPVFKQGLKFLPSRTRELAKYEPELAGSIESDVREIISLFSEAEKSNPEDPAKKQAGSDPIVSRLAQKFASGGKRE